MKCVNFFYLLIKRTRISGQTTQSRLRKKSSLTLEYPNNHLACTIQHVNLIEGVFHSRRRLSCYRENLLHYLEDQNCNVKTEITINTYFKNTKTAVLCVVYASKQARLSCMIILGSSSSCRLIFVCSDCR